MQVSAMTRGQLEEYLNWQYAPPFERYTIRPENRGEDRQEALGGFENWFAVSEPGQGMVGMYEYEFCADGSVEIGLGMRPDHVGCGNGAAFVRGCVLFCREHYGHKGAITLRVLEENERARHVYEKAGFRVCGRAEGRDHGKPVQFICMRLETGEPEIRTTESAELDGIYALVQETIRAVYPRYYPAGAVDFFAALHSRERIAEAIRLGQVFSLYAGGELCGTVMVHENEISRLVVLPQEQKKGYGTALLRFAENRIRRDYDAVCVDASLPAKSMYLKCGYTFAAYRTLRTENGDYLCYDRMVLKVTGRLKRGTRDDERNI